MAHDFAVLGRTARAYASHPRAQRDTVAILNYVFGRLTRLPWDVMVGARGLSPQAAETVLAECADDQISVDVTWPLYLLRRGGFRCGYREAEGLEFETAGRHADEVLAAGGEAVWREAIDGDPAQWLHRLDLARRHVAAMHRLVVAAASAGQHPTPSTAGGA